MEKRLEKKSVLKKTLQVGGNTLISRMLGLTREILLMQFLGLGALADGFTTAFMIPNSLRKIFAEGALTAAFAPSFIAIFKTEGKHQANSIMALAFVVFESALLILCAFVMWKPEFVVKLIAPGYAASQIAATVPALRILMPFIFFISTSALLTSALQSVHHFFVPSFSPVLLNTVFIGALVASIKYKLPMTYLCFAILFGGFIQCLLHVYMYFKLGFSFEWWNKKTIGYFLTIMKKFLVGFLSMSVMELNLFVDQYFISYFAVGSATLLKYANRFMGIPLGVFAVAFSTILLPHFTRMKMEEPEELENYLFEVIKFVIWVTVPAILIMTYLSSDIFLTLFASVNDSFTPDRVVEAGHILTGFLLGLCFFSLNKILFSLFYALHDTKNPTFIALIVTIANVLLNYLLVGPLGIFGLSCATSISGGIQTSLALYFLHTKHNFSLRIKDLLLFSMKYGAQVLITVVPFYFIYGQLHALIRPMAYGNFFTQSFGYWLWVGPLGLMILGSLYLGKKLFRIELYFLS